MSFGLNNKYLVNENEHVIVTDRDNTDCGRVMRVNAELPHEENFQHVTDRDNCQDASCA